MRYKVLLISLHDVWGTKESFSPLYKIINYLASNGYCIDFITIEKNKIFDDASKMYGEPIKFIHKNVNITRLRIGKPLFLRILFYFPVIKRIVAKIRNEILFPYRVYGHYLNKGKQYDFVYAYEVYAVSVSKRISSELKKPLITRFQGTFLMSWFESHRLRYFQSKYRLHIKALSTPADLIIMTDDGTRGNQALKLVNNFKNVLFLKNGFDFQIKEYSKHQARESLKLPQNVIITISCGRLAKWKKFERIILAYEILLKNKTNYLHLFIGGGEEHDFLLAEAKTRKIENNVMFVGQITHEMVSMYLSAADIFLSFFDYTNTGNPLLEAIKMEVPIITYDVGDTSKLIKDSFNGVLLNSPSPRLIAKAIEQMTNDNEFRDNLKKGLHETSKKLWNWEKRLEFEENAIRNLII